VEFGRKKRKTNKKKEGDWANSNQKRQGKIAKQMPVMPPACCSLILPCFVLISAISAGLAS
jgi:hypothetical protein